MDETIRKAIERLDAASVEMEAAILEINVLWNRPRRGEPALTPLEIEACRAAGRRARRGGWSRPGPNVTARENTLSKIRGIVIAHSKGIGTNETAIIAIASILRVKAPRRSR